MGGLDPIEKYYGCKHHLANLSSGVVPVGLGNYIQKLAREMWERQATERGYDPTLIKAYGEQLSKGIDKGFGKPKIETDFITPDQQKLHSLKQNVWQFSTAKTYSQLREMSDALSRPDGTLRTFDEFRIQTALITGKQLRHLRTEYNTAVAGAQMASKWLDIQRMKESFPLLEFVAVEDDHTSALCMSLSGVIRPVDDPLWLQFYPPNHYNCRSTVKQLRKGDITPDEQIVRPDIPGIFKVNLGERGLAFPEDHAYFEQTPPEVMREARQHYPYAMQFDILDESDVLKGIVRQHYSVDKTAPDYERNLQIALDRASKRKTVVDLMPTLDPDTYASQRLTIFPDAKMGKSPDLRIDKVLWEEEGVFKHTRRAIKGAIEAGAKQANHIIVSLPTDMIIDFDLNSLVKLKFMDHKQLMVIVFKQGEIERRFDRK